MENQANKGRPPVKEKSRVQEYVSAGGYFVFRVAGIVFLMSFLYLLVVYFGQNIRTIGSMKPDDQIYFAKALKGVTLVCFWSGMISIISSAIAFILDYAYGRAIFVLGLAFAYGLPYLLYYYTPTGDFQKVFYYLPGDPAPHYFLTEFTAMYTKLGYAMLVVGVILLLRELVLEIRDAFRKNRVTKKQVRVRKKLDLGLNVHCWDTNFCTPEIKKVCPAFAARRNCWKMGTGCCDESLVLTSLAGSKNKYSDRLKDMLNPHSKEEFQKRECRTCHIYMAHQKYKYRALMPVVILVALGIGYLCYKPLLDYFHKAVMEADRFASFLITSNQLMLDSEAKLMWFVIFAVVMAVFAIAAAGVSLLNYLIFKLKL
ncbi:MAG: hypothetical protein IJT95_01015 [Abditibacteriota bacterium]|nr:hypothetical protein [Abditibacteriota bacterium]